MMSLPKLAVVLLIALAVPVAAQDAVTSIVVFDFELDDASPSHGVVSGHDDDSHLAAASAEVRRALAQSGRYRLIDVGAADAAAVRDHVLRNCNGCDAPIAAALGARQSLTGVIRRVSRTEYQVGFRLRDAASGELITVQGTDLRMGANYAWSRGAKRLIEDRLLQTAAK